MRYTVGLYLFPLSKLLYRKPNFCYSDTTGGLLRWVQAFLLKGDSKRGERSAQSKAEIKKIGNEPKRAPILGSILVVCLWAFIILSILSVAVANFVFGQIRFANFFIRQTASLYIAKAACQDAFYERKQDPTADYDSLRELSQEKISNFGGNSYKYFFIDESSNININTASKKQLMRLPGLEDEDLVEAIVNSDRRPFKIKEELLLIEGITTEEFDQFKDLITVFGAGKININTASAGVLSALGLDEDLIDIILRYREESPGPDEEFGTEDDGAFTNQATILSDLRDFEMLSLAQQQQLISVKNLLTVKSTYLQLRILPQIKQKSGVNYSVVIDTSKNKIRYWLEDKF